MATKAQEAKDGCLAKAGDDEPIFVLRSTDKLAPRVVRFWAYLARREGTSNEKTHEAIGLARMMEEWAIKHGGSKTPD